MLGYVRACEHMTIQHDQYRHKVSETDTKIMTRGRSHCCTKPIPVCEMHMCVCVYIDIYIYIHMYIYIYIHILAVRM